MSFNISSSYMKHIGRLDATIDFNTMSSRSIAMMKTYVRTGVMKTTGVTGQLAKWIRFTNGKQYVHVKNNTIFARNIKDKEVYDAVTAALTLCRVEGADRNYIHVRVGLNERWTAVSALQLMEERPSHFSIWTQNLASHFHLRKLSDTMEVNTDEPMVVNLKAFMED